MQEINNDRCGSIGKRIGVFGHVGNGNLGDEAIMSAVIQSIKHRCPGAEIVGFTLNPKDTRERHKIAAVPIRRIGKIKENATFLRPSQAGDQKYQQSFEKLLSQIKTNIKNISLLYAFLKKLQKSWHALQASVKELRFVFQCYRNIKGIDFLIIAGSHQLIDCIAGGAWGHPYTLFKWVLVAKMVKTKVAFMSVGAGPVQSLLGKFFIKNALLLGSYRSYRDEVSRKCVEKLGVSGHGAVFPDLVFGLCLKSASHHIPSITRSIVGINPVPFKDPQYWLGSSDRGYDIYIRKLADFALWVMEKDYKLLFFPTQLRLDPQVIEDIRILINQNKILDTEQDVIDYPVHSMHDLVSAICMTDIVVATRFHGIAIPYLLNKPVMGIAYHEKTVELMRQLGQAEYTLDILQFGLEAMQAKFVALESRKAAIKEEIAQRISAHRDALEVQYERVFRYL